METIKVKYVNNDDDGATQEMEIAAEISVDAFLYVRLGTDWQKDYTVRVNRDPVDPEDVLLPGSRISVTHKKQDGN